MLVLALTVRSSPHERVVHPQPSKDGGSVRFSEDCLNQKDLKFPTMVKVDVRISNSDHAFRMVHDVRNRSLAPWDYRYLFSSYLNCNGYATLMVSVVNDGKFSAYAWNLVNIAVTS